MKIFLDIETISPVDLRKTGVTVYAHHPDTVISVLCWKDSQGEHIIVNPAVCEGLARKQDIAALKALCARLKADGTTIVAHNAAFERTVLTYKFSNLVQQFGFTGDISPDLIWECTRIRSYMNGGPGTLDAAARFFGCKYQKDRMGHSIMTRIRKPIDKLPKREGCTVMGLIGTHKRVSNHLYRAGVNIYKRMAEYCMNDVRATEDLYNALLKLDNHGVFKKFHEMGAKLTDKMNRRGIHIDGKLLEKLQEAKDDNERKLNNACRSAFGVESYTQRPTILRVLKAAGARITKLGRLNVEEALKKNNIPKEFREPLEEYIRRNKTSLNKVNAVADRMHDGKVKDMFTYCGAATTGRWASSGVQLQNLPRPKQSFEKCAADLSDPDNIISCLRGLIIPTKGKFFISDLSGIELRMALYHGGYDEELQEIKKGKDPYKGFAAEALGKEEKDITSEERTMGKVAMLSLQYGTGAKKLQTTCRDVWGCPMSREQSETFTKTWRTKYSKITNIWRQNQAKIEKAIANQEDLQIKLRSGRTLVYKTPRTQVVKYDDGTYRNELQYWDGRRWLSFWGGVLFNHTIQGECRDLLLLKMLGMDQRGHEIVMTIHDEVVIDTKQDEQVEKDWEAAGTGAITRIWPGLPLASESQWADRYGK